VSEEKLFPEEVEKKIKILPITKPGKETSTDVSKFSPISLINVGGKVLEKILINKIMHNFTVTTFRITTSSASPQRRVP